MPRLKEPLEVSSSLSIPATELRLAYSRAGGPGGQHVNKTASRVQLFWNLRTSDAPTDEDRAWLERRLASRLTKEGDVVVTAETERSQSRNVELAVERFVELLREALRRPKKRRKTRPTAASRKRRLDAKRRRGELKQSRRDPRRD